MSNPKVGGGPGLKPVTLIPEVKWRWGKEKLTPTKSSLFPGMELTVWHILYTSLQLCEVRSPKYRQRWISLLQKQKGKCDVRDGEGSDSTGLLRVPWTARRSNQSILKEISPAYPLEGLMLKLKLQYYGHLIWRTDSLGKILMLGKTEGRRRGGWQRMR